MTNNASLVKGIKLAAFLGLLIGIFNFFLNGFTVMLLAINLEESQK